ncbi:MAG: MlaA family lipoprotein [Gammaproteobacteria bacterium]
MSLHSTKTIQYPVCLLFLSMLAAGCADSPSAPVRQEDPLEKWNRGTHDFNDSLDRNVLKPVAKGYHEVTPEPVNESVTNFFSNIGDIGVMVNDFLQLKVTQGGMDLSRFLINTTVGVVGLFDVAQKIDLPKHNEDFGQTLGVWGVPSGDYLVLPFFGPSSTRDTAGLVGDALLNPITYVSVVGGAAVNAVTTGSKLVEITDARADMLSSEKVLDEAAVDRYDFIKNAYLQHRQYLVYDGNPPEEESDDFSLEDDLTSESDTDGIKTTDSNLPPVTNGAIDLGKQNNTEGPAPVVNQSRYVLDLTAD